MMQEVEVLKTIQELICSFFSEEQFTLSSISISSHSPFILCYNVLCDFASLVFALMRVRKSL